jgi:hypothetical protein
LLAVERAHPCGFDAYALHGAHLLADDNESPTSKGWSKNMVKKQNISASTLCAAKGDGYAADCRAP